MDDRERSLQFFAIRRARLTGPGPFERDTRAPGKRPYRLEVNLNKTISAAVSAFILGSVTSGVLLAQAQPAAPPGGAAEAPAGEDGPTRRGPGGGPGGGMGPGGSGGGPMAGWMQERHAHRMEL